MQEVAGEAHRLSYQEFQIPVARMAQLSAPLLPEVACHSFVEPIEEGFGITHQVIDGGIGSIPLHLNAVRLIHNEHITARVNRFEQAQIHLTEVLRGTREEQAGRIHDPYLALREVLSCLMYRAEGAQRAGIAFSFLIQERITRFVAAGNATPFCQEAADGARSSRPRKSRTLLAPKLEDILRHQLTRIGLAVLEPVRTPLSPQRRGCRDPQKPQFARQVD